MKFHSATKRLSGLPAISLTLFCFWLWLGACTPTRSTPKLRQNTTPDDAAITTTANTHQMKPKDPDPVDKLRLRISVEDPLWNREKSTIVRLSIENLSEDVTEIKGMTSFQLISRSPSDERPTEGKTFSGPYDPLNNTAKPSGELKIRLAPRQTMNTEIAMKDLRWGRLIYSTWPNQDLFTAIPQGEFKLLFEISVIDGSYKLPNSSTEVPLTKRIQSNEVMISLQ